MALDYTATYDPGGVGTVLLIAFVRKTLQDIDVTSNPPSPIVPRSQWSVLFTDQEIMMIADQYSAFPNQADMMAAHLFDDIAGNAALLAQHLTLGDYSSDTRVTPRTIRDHADYIRNRYAKALAAGADEPAESVSDEVWTDFDWRRAIFAAELP
jgi:hypothetical protein